MSSNQLFSSVNIGNVLHESEFLYKFKQLVTADAFISLKLSENKLLSAEKEFKTDCKSLKEVVIIPKLLKQRKPPSRMHSQATHLQFLYKYRTNDQVKNHPIHGVSVPYEEPLRNIFHNCNFRKLVLTQKNSSTAEMLSTYYRIKKSPDGVKLVLYHQNRESLPVQDDIQSLQHNNNKNHWIPKESILLQKLNISTLSSSIVAPLSSSPASSIQLRSDMKDKFYQINQFLDIFHSQLQSILNPSSTSNQTLAIQVTDMGCGKGYLTFAIYEYLSRLSHFNSSQIAVIGVEQRKELIDIMNRVKDSKELNYQHLQFVHGNIQDYTEVYPRFDFRQQQTTPTVPKVIKVLVALHACDIATDQAILHGIQHQYDIILVAPCCQKELRSSLKSMSQKLLIDTKRHQQQQPQRRPLLSTALRKSRYKIDSQDFSSDPKLEEVSPPVEETALSSVLEYNIFRERWLDMITDTLRSLGLRYSDYDTNIQEFITSDHTAKNILITARKRNVGLQPDVNRPSDQEIVKHQILDLMKLNGIHSQYLIDRLFSPNNGERV